MSRFNGRHYLSESEMKSLLRWRLGNGLWVGFLLGATTVLFIIEIFFKGKSW